MAVRLEIERNGNTEIIEKEFESSNQGSLENDIIFGRKDFKKCLDSEELRYISREHFKITKAMVTGYNVYTIKDISKTGTSVEGKSLKQGEEREIENSARITLADGVLSGILKGLSQPFPINRES